MIVNRGPRSTAIHGDGQVRTALEAMLGLDEETLRVLTQPRSRFEFPPAGEIRTLLRRLLGERRMQELEVEFADSPAHSEEETVARARVGLADAVMRAAANEGEIDRLDRDLRRWRIRQALQTLTEASERAAAADATERRYRVLRGKFLDERERLVAYRELAGLWADHARSAAQAKHAREHVERFDARLAEIASLAQRAQAAAERLAALDRACDAAKSVAETSQAADRARAQRDEHQQAAHELRRARSDLVEAEVVHAKARAAAERAHTLRKRAHEDEHLPAAHQRWSQLSDILQAEVEHSHDEVDASALTLETTRLKQRLRSLAIEGQRRRNRLMVSAIGVALGIVLATIGFSGTGPLAVLGVVTALAGAAAGAWSLWSQRADRAHEDELLDRLAELDHDLRASEHHAARVAANRRRRAKIEQELERLGVEIPTSAERARIMRDSATARLRRMADGDSAASTGDLEAEYTQTQQESAHAEREVQRLHARIRALEESGAEEFAAAAEAELRSQIAASGRARGHAAELARSLDLPDERRRLADARDAQQRDLNAMQERLDRAADLEAARQRAVWQQRAAEDALPGIAQAIDALVATDSALPRFEPRAEAIGRLDGLAALADVVAAVGEARATTQVTQEMATARAARDSVARATTELAGAVRAAGVHVDAAPTASEVRAIFPGLDEDRLEDPSGARRRMQRARAERRELDGQIRQLELRTGAVRHEVDLEAARASLDDLVDRRRVRTAASRLMAHALDSLAGGVRPATEAALRQIIGRVTGGSYWDVRIAQDQTVQLWDEERQVWTPLRDVADELRARLGFAVGMAFLSAVRPHDAPHAPAFLWLDAGKDDANAIEPSARRTDACRLPAALSAGHRHGCAGRLDTRGIRSRRTHRRRHVGNHPRPRRPPPTGSRPLAEASLVIRRGTAPNATDGAARPAPKAGTRGPAAKAGTAAPGTKAGAKAPAPKQGDKSPSGARPRNSETARLPAAQRAPTPRAGLHPRYQQPHVAGRAGHVGFGGICARLHVARPDGERLGLRGLDRLWGIFLRLGYRRVAANQRRRLRAQTAGINRHAAGRPRRRGRRGGGNRGRQSGRYPRGSDLDRAGDHQRRVAPSAHAPGPVSAPNPQADPYAAIAELYAAEHEAWDARSPDVRSPF